MNDNGLNSRYLVIEKKPNIGCWCVCLKWVWWEKELSDCIVQWLTRSPDTREIPSSSLGIVIFSFHSYDVHSLNTRTEVLEQTIDYKITHKRLEALFLSCCDLLHLIIHLVWRWTHNQVTNGISSNCNICIGTKDVNSNHHTIHLNHTSGQQGQFDNE